MKEEEIQRSQPPGRTKILNAMRTLLESKDFSSIKIAELAQTAGVTEPLIYKYFRDKRDVIHVLLQDYLETRFVAAINELRTIQGSLNKLEYFIHSYINAYNEDRVIARVVLLEVSNSYDYYESQSYMILKKYGDLILTIIREGIEEGVIRDDMDPLLLRNLLFGGMDRACLHPIVFNKPINVESLSRDLTRLVFDAITAS